VIQCCAVLCSVLQRGAVCCSVGSKVPHSAVWCRAVQFVAMCCSEGLFEHPVSGKHTSPLRALGLFCAESGASWAMLYGNSAFARE